MPMAQRSNGEGTGPAAGSSRPEGFPSQRELIVIAKSETGLRARPEGVTSVTGANVDPLRDLLASEGATLQPLFGASEERLNAEAARLATTGAEELPDLSVFYRVEAPDERLDDLAESIRQMDGIEGAYVKPPAEPAQVVEPPAPAAEEPPAVTANFTSRQDYLERAPVGIDAIYAATRPGGRGVDVNIIDIEWGWRFTHEDLIQNQGGIVAGTGSPNDDHGTAVIGEFSGDRNTFGITGISPAATVFAVSLVSFPESQAIRIAADRLRPGDIILLEVHRPGPRGPGPPPRYPIRFHSHRMVAGRSRRYSLRSKQRRDCCRRGR